MFFRPETEDHIVTPAKAWMLGLLCATWLCTGLIGHDPWKPYELDNFGFVYHILKTGDWLVPTLAGEPTLEEPPLYYITAAASAKLFSPLLPYHDGARLASGFYTFVTLLFMGLTGRDLFGKGRGWSSAIILVGSLGLLVPAHLLVPDLAFLAGCSVMLYGYTLALRFRRRSGIFLGTGLGIGFMAKGLVAPILFVLISAALLLFPNWRHRPYYSALLIAALCASPWLCVWPWLLYRHSPHLFLEWFWTNSIEHWLSYLNHDFLGNIWLYLQVLPWFAWPAWPLAAWGIWRSRHNLRYEVEYQLLITSTILMTIVFGLSPGVKDLVAMPLLLPLALLATAALSSLHRGAANALDWFGIMTFGLLAILMWWGWTGLLVDSPAKITYWLKQYQPDFQPTASAPSFWIAVASSIAWIVLVWRTGRSIRRSVINWAGGMTLLCVLTMTLWLPWLENGKSYRTVVASLKQKLPAHYNCITREFIDRDQRAMLEYFGNIVTRPYSQNKCDLLLVQEERGRTAMNTGHWKKIWTGARAGDKQERFNLYQKVAG